VFPLSRARLLIERGFGGTNNGPRQEVIHSNGVMSKGPAWHIGNDCVIAVSTVHSFFNRFPLYSQRKVQNSVLQLQALLISSSSSDLGRTSHRQKAHTTMFFTSALQVVFKTTGGRIWNKVGCVWSAFKVCAAGPAVH
jgi:hypothetical protein